MPENFVAENRMIWSVLVYGHRTPYVSKSMVGGEFEGTIVEYCAIITEFDLSNLSFIKSSLQS